MSAHRMISPDLLVNLVLAPVGFLLLVVIRERLRRACLPHVPRGPRKALRVRSRRAIVWKRENVRGRM